MLGSKPLGSFIQAVKIFRFFHHQVTQAQGILVIAEVLLNFLEIIGKNIFGAQAGLINDTILFCLAFVKVFDQTKRQINHSS